MDETQNPPASSPTEEAATTEPSRPHDGDNSSEPQTVQDALNPSGIRNENNQMPLNITLVKLTLSKESQDKILSIINRELGSDQSEGPSDLELSLAVSGGLSSPALAGSSRLNPTQNPGQQQQQFTTRSSVRATSSDARLGTLTPPTEATTTTVRASGDLTSWSAQPVGNLNSLFGSTSRGVTNTLPPSSSVQPVGHHHHHGMLPEPEVQTHSLIPMHSQAYSITPSVSSGLSYPHVIMREVPTFHGPQYHPGMLPEAPMLPGLQYLSLADTYRLGMLPVVPTVQRPLVSPAARHVMTQPRRTAGRGQPLRASPQAAAVRPSGYVCPVCDRDLAFPAEGQVNQPGLRHTVSFLSCGHSFHDDCLQGITPEGSPDETPCPVCARGVET